MLSMSDQSVVVPVYVFSFFLFFENVDIICGGYCDYPLPARLV